MYSLFNYANLKQIYSIFNYANLKQMYSIFNYANTLERAISLAGGSKEGN